MNKKIFGIKLGTIITMLVCLAIAFLIWILVEYKLHTPLEQDNTVSSAFVYASKVFKRLK